MGKSKQGGNGKQVKKSAGAQPKKKSGPLKAVKAVKGRRKDGQLEIAVMSHQQLSEGGKQQIQPKPRQQAQRGSQLDREYEALKQRQAAASRSRSAQQQQQQQQHGQLQLAPSTLASAGEYELGVVDPLARHMQELQPDDNHEYTYDRTGYHEDDEVAGAQASSGTFGILYDGSDDDEQPKTQARRTHPGFSLAQPTFSVPVHNNTHQPFRQHVLAPHVAVGGVYDDDEL